ncbi:MAG: alpha/beta hydrolase [Deltaproteobacteria bacterium]|nr:alpha/beta hydrolase [Deltaproteobacteria bacterium]
MLACAACASPNLAGLQLREDVAYAGTRHKKQQLDLYLPDDAARFRPIAVFVHGGAWKELDRRMVQWVTGYFGRTGEFLARQGYVAAVVGYRQPPEAGMAEGLGDVARAVAWLQAHALELGGNPRCVVLIGHSGGALVAGLLGYDGARLKAVGGDATAVAGVAHLAGLYDPDALLAHVTGSDREKIEGFYGHDGDARRAWAVDRLLLPESPTTVVLGAGDDTPGLVEQHRRMAERVAAAGPRHAAQVLDVGHMGAVPQPGNRAAEAMQGWLAAARGRCATDHGSDPSPTAR